MGAGDLEQSTPPSNMNQDIPSILEAARTSMERTSKKRIIDMMPRASEL